MKCIAYISQVKIAAKKHVIPSGLSGIYAHARKANSIRGITGIISYKSNHYFQIIEGNDSAVDELYEKIKTDDRHEKIIELVNKPIRNKNFPEWSMKLISLNAKTEEFNSFIKAFTNDLISLPPEKLVHFQKFYKIKNVNTTNSTAPIKQGARFSGTTLTLVGWPDFNAFEPSPDFIEMCAKLINAPCSYNSLIETQGSLVKEGKLDHTLSKLKALGLLKETKNSADLRKPKTSSHSPNTGFYGQMKNFLRLRR